MDIVSVLKQIAQSLLARRKKWVILTTVTALAMLLPAAYLLSKEPPRYRTVATIFLESRAGTSLFQELTPFRAGGSIGHPAEQDPRPVCHRGAPAGVRRGPHRESLQPKLPGSDPELVPAAPGRAAHRRESRRPRRRRAP